MPFAKLVLLSFAVASLAAWTQPPRTDGMPIPGLDAGVGCGYDAVDENPRAGAELKMINGKKSIVYNPSAHRGPLINVDPTDGDAGPFGVRKWRNPYFGTQDVYPGSLWVRIPTVVMTHHELISETKSFDALFKYKSSSFGVGLGFTVSIYGVPVKFDGAFKRTKQELNQMAKNQSSNFHLSETYINFYEFGVNMMMENMLSPPAKFMIDSMDPDHYDPHVYDSFISFFGTHYIKQASFGLKVNTTTVFSEALLKKFGSAFCEMQAKIGVHIAETKIGLDLNYDHATNETKQNEDFKKDSLSELTYIGGLADVLASDGYNTWVKTGSVNPALIVEKSSFVPIHTIISNPKKREYLRQHLIAYLQTGQLKNL